MVRDVIIDDRENFTVGKKLREALQIGYRFIILFGKNSLDEGLLNLINKYRVVYLNF